MTKTTLSLWSKEAVARRPSLSGLQSTLFTGWSEICRIEILLHVLGILSLGGRDTWSSLPKNGETNLIEPNQIASSVPIVTILSYFFLDQWGINIHLLCKKCFNIPHLSRSLSSTIEGSPHKFDHRPSITFTESPITVHTDQSSPGAAGEVWGCLELPGHLCFSEAQCWIKGKTCGEVLSSLPFWANRMKKKIKFVKVFKEAISVNLIWIFVLVETKCSRTSACVDKV